MPRDLPPEAGAIFRFIAERTGAEVSEARIETLAGGAVLRHDRLDFTLSGGTMPGPQSWVLRRDGASKLGLGLTRAREFALQRALFRAGLAVAEPLVMCCDESVFGAPFFLMRRLDGVADGAAVVQQGENAALAGALGAELARLHGLDLGGVLQVLGAPPEDAATARLAELAACLEADEDPHPVAQWALRWLERRKPSPAKPVLCHGDFRTGNYLVQDGRLAGVLDWDFAHWGDPDEDIAWFCSRHWRFGAVAREAGGIAPRESFYRAYEAVAARMIDCGRVRYWAVMASLRWLVIALKQRDRFLKRGECSLDLALTGRRVAECEHEILVLTSEPGSRARPALCSKRAGEEGCEGSTQSGFRDRPSGDELATLARPIGGADPLAMRAAAIAGRERASGAAAFDDCRAMLATRYGAAADRVLLERFAEEIHAGVFDRGTAQDDALAVMAAITRQKLEGSNPEFLAAEETRGPSSRTV
ncbi:MAG TPA: phosphotransferase family protein [Stellaceae bacterium]|nr:phosphotransferase family protein [Stellaceae bacterium]